MNRKQRSEYSTIPKSSPIRVGFIGLSSSKGWAVKTHYQAILQLSSQFQITALYNKKTESSIATIRDLKLTNAVAYPTLESFASSSNVDMVVFSVRTASYFELLMPLLEYSRANCNLKYLFMEWGLVYSVKEMETVFHAASERGLQTIISLQGRKSPYIIRSKELIEEGHIGDINSIEITGNGGWYGYERPLKSPSYLYEVGKGVDLVTTSFAHTIDLLQYITGSYFGVINAMVFNNIPEQELVDEFGRKLGKTVPKSAPDHLLFQGTLLKSNVPVSCSFKGGSPTKKFTKNLVIDIHGTKGDLKLEGDAGFIEISNLVLYYRGVKVNEFPNKKGQIIYEESFGDEVTEVFHLRNYNAMVGNIYRLYESIADFHFNSKNVPDLPSRFVMQGFEYEGFPTLMDALILCRLVESVYKSSSLGATLNVSNISRYQ
ncbi:hypothetical protein SUVZ_10G2420 [Saccharomyces uvarum]|uniref:Galactose/lactose metabolism regulatory protein GAL80 n=1 Tax=Saccharomyces uvarum TaxID=230603 RepID=A0ABN8WF58_SACUV|nr:hypothetical protein SUVZ_10G2420 [Saccharomyces uvarum]